MYGFLVIFNSEFCKNIVRGGGVLFVYNKNGSLIFNMMKVNFIECVVEKYGCVVLVGDFNFLENWLMYKVYVSIREMLVWDCFYL